MYLAIIVQELTFGSRFKIGKVKPKNRSASLSFRVVATALKPELPAHYCVKGLLLSAGALVCTPEVNPPKI